MDKAPAIGSHVRYFSDFGTKTREVTGEVVAIHPRYEYSPEDSSTNLVEVTDQKTWKVTVRVDYLPPWWPYGRTENCFCPSVYTLTEIDNVKG